MKIMVKRRGAVLTIDEKQLVQYEQLGYKKYEVKPAKKPIKKKEVKTEE